MNTTEDLNQHAAFRFAIIQHQKCYRNVIFEFGLTSDSMCHREDSIAFGGRIIPYLACSTSCARRVQIE
jgi:hypothetical protein